FSPNLLLLFLLFTFVTAVILSILDCKSLIFAVLLGKLVTFSVAIRLNESNFSISLSKSACSLGVIRPSFLISFVLLLIFVCAAFASAIAFLASDTCFVSKTPLLSALLTFGDFTDEIWSSFLCNSALLAVQFGT